LYFLKLFYYLYIYVKINKKNMKKHLKDQRGLSLIELLIAVAIMVVVAVAVTNIMMHTIRIALLNSQETISESGAQNIVRRIAEDVRAATSFAGGLGASSNAGPPVTIIMRLYGHNLDSYATASPIKDDPNYDISCYSFTAPSPPGGRGTAGYIPGYIKAGMDNGDPTDGTCIGSMTQLSGASTDVVDFQVRYCRPSNGVPGTYTCSSNVVAGSMTTDSTCVWMVKIFIKTQRLAKLYYSDAHPITTYSTASRPRNTYLAALSKKQDDDGDQYPDCCDADKTGAANVTWCPPPK
jgi:prepilin-type N-terminal cleavage/methylation domain-containing protein